MDQDKRRHPRLMVNLPVQAQVGDTGIRNLKVLDISATGMQVQCSDFHALELGFDAAHNEAHFEIQIDARMAWVQNEDGYFLTGWEFAFGRLQGNGDVVLRRESEDKRRHERLNLEIPIQAQVGDGQIEDLELVDISPSGMQLRCRNFDMIRNGLNPHTNRAQFTILLEARLAWVQSGDENDFITGWEFGEDTGEERIG